MKRLTCMAVFLAALSLTFCTKVVAQEVGGEAVEEPKYTAVYAEVKAVDEAATTLTTLEYDYEKEIEVEVVYKVEEDAEFEGVESLREIKQGDWVDLEYYTNKKGEKITDYIAVEREPVLEEEEPLETEEPIEEPPATQ